jgi:hypothetical protein
VIAPYHHLFVSEHPKSIEKSLISFSLGGYGTILNYFSVELWGAKNKCNMTVDNMLLYMSGV